MMMFMMVFMGFLFFKVHQRAVPVLHYVQSVGHRRAEAAAQAETAEEHFPRVEGRRRNEAETGSGEKSALQNMIDRLGGNNASPPEHNTGKMRKRKKRKK